MKENLLVRVIEVINLFTMGNVKTQIVKSIDEFETQYKINSPLNAN